MATFTLWLMMLTLLLLPFTSESGKTQKKKRFQPTTPRLRQRSSDIADRPPTINYDWYTRSYEDWQACSSEVLNLVAMDNNIIIPPRADRALFLYNYFQRTAPATTSVIQPPILPPALTISIPRSSITTRTNIRPSALAQPGTDYNPFAWLSDSVPATINSPTPVTSTLLPNIDTSPITCSDRLLVSHTSTCRPATSSALNNIIPPATITFTTPSSTSLAIPAVPVLPRHPAVHQSPMLPTTTVPVLPRHPAVHQPPLLPTTTVGSATPLQDSSTLISEMSNRIMSSVQQSLAIQNSALLQQIQVLHDRISDTQDSRTNTYDPPQSSVSQIVPAAVPTHTAPVAASTHVSFPLNVPDPIAASTRSTTTAVSYPTFNPLPPTHLDQYGLPSDAQYREPAIKESILLKIRAGKYVDLTKLTPRAVLDANEGFQMVIGADAASGDPAVNVFPSTLKGAFKSFREWLAAFLVFAQAYLGSFAAHAGGVMAYIERITMYSSRYPLDNWVAYDRMFRQQLPTTPRLRWGVEDKALFDLCLAGYRIQASSPFAFASSPATSATCYRCGIVGHYASSCPQRSAAPASHQATPTTSTAVSPFRAPQRPPFAAQPPPLLPTQPFRTPRPSSFTFESSVC